MCESSWAITPSNSLFSNSLRPFTPPKCWPRSCAASESPRARLLVEGVGLVVGEEPHSHERDKMRQHQRASDHHYNTQDFHLYEPTLSGYRGPALPPRQCLRPAARNLRAARGNSMAGWRQPCDLSRGFGRKNVGLWRLRDSPPIHSGRGAYRAFRALRRKCGNRVDRLFQSPPPAVGGCRAPPPAAAISDPCH